MTKRNSPYYRTPLERERDYDAENLFPDTKEGRNFFPDANDASIIMHDTLINKTRVKLSLKEAIAQGIITQTDVNPRFTIILPVRTQPNYYYWITCYSKAMGRNKLWVDTYFKVPAGDIYHLPVRLNPEARLHIIVN